MNLFKIILKYEKMYKKYKANLTIIDNNNKPTIFIKRK